LYSATASLVTAFEAEDAAITNAYQLADTALQSNIDTLSSNITAELHSATGSIITNFEAADTAIRAELYSATASLVTDFEAADLALSSSLVSTIAGVSSVADANTADIANLQSIINMVPQDPLPAATVGDLSVSGSIGSNLHLYFYNGVSWVQIS
jgi:hypothetical protein